MEKQQGGSRENAGRKKTQNIRVFLTVSPETEKTLKEFKERWQRTFPKSKTGYVREIDERLKLMLRSNIEQPEKVTPKPITEDFLIGLGFEKSTGLMSWSYFSNEKIELSTYSKTNKYRFLLRNGTSKIFKYQHQIEKLIDVLK